MNGLQKIQIDQIHEHWVHVVSIEGDEESFDLPRSLFDELSTPLQEGQVYTLSLVLDLHTEKQLKEQTQKKLNQLFADDQGEDFEL